MELRTFKSSNKFGFKEGKYESPKEIIYKNFL